jgi:hypothetical protein
LILDKVYPREQEMVKIENTLFCDGCGVEIPLSPVIKDQREYCCEDCAQGYQCKCGERMELEMQRRAGGSGVDILDEGD